MRARRALRLALASALVLTGCTALLDVKEIFLDPNATAGGGEGGTYEGSTTDGPAGDGGVDGSCKADFLTDKKHCGRCGHDCFGGACNAGKCEAIELASITDAPLYDVVASAQHVFMATALQLTTQVGGIWRVPKNGGAPEAYVTLRYARAMAVLGDLLYFVVADSPANGATDTGGLYSCPLAGASPCVPKLLSASTNPRAIAIDKGTIFYGDNLAGKGLMAYAPPAAPTVFRTDFGFSGNYFVDGTAAFYTTVIFNNPQRAKVFQILPDGSVDETYFYENPKASDGVLRGTPTTLFFTGYNYLGTAGGIVRRIPRAGGPPPCDYGGATNKRPYGLAIDATHIYWTNMGEGAAEPYTGGSLVRCELAGCCATPDVMWTGEGQPTAVTADADAVYFTTKAKGSLWKIAKP